MGVMLNMPFRILLASISSRDVHVPRQMIMGRQCRKLTAVVGIKQLAHTSAEGLSCAEAFSSHQSDNKHMQSPDGSKVQLSNDWCSSIFIPDEYASYYKNFITMLKPFNLLKEGHLYHVSIATHSVKSDPLATWSINSILYHVGPRARNFEKSEGK